MVDTTEKIQPIKNVEGVIGRYTREFYKFEDFNKVSTPYTPTTCNLEIYLKRRINRAKDILKVFKKLEKEGYSITTVETSYFGEKCYNTEIAGIFNGNIHDINVLWGDKADYYDRGNCIEDGFKQTVHAFIL